MLIGVFEGFYRFATKPADLHIAYRRCGMGVPKELAHRTASEKHQTGLFTISFGGFATGQTDLSGVQLEAEGGVRS